MQGQTGRKKTRRQPGLHQENCHLLKTGQWWNGVAESGIYCLQCPSRSSNPCRSVVSVTRFPIQSGKETEPDTQQCADTVYLCALRQSTHEQAKALKC
jgi:hypothetical protein